MIIVSIHDTKAETWSVPVCAQSKAAALRDFGLACTKSDTMMSQCPTDFDLWQFGDWNADVNQPSLVSCPPLHLANGADYVKREH